MATNIGRRIARIGPTAGFSRGKSSNGTFEVSEIRKTALWLGKKLPEATRDRLRVAVSESTKRVKDFAKEGAPTDTGDLKRKIGRRVGRKGSKTELLGVVQSSAYYSLFVERGHEHPGFDVPPHPYLVPAVERDSERFFREAEKAVLGAAEATITQ